MTISDIDLVMLAKAAQDDAAFAELVRRHQAGLRTFLRKFTPDFTYADDIAQEAFLKAYRGLAGFEGGASFRSWLYAIAWREFLQGKRRDDARDRLAEAVAANDDYPDAHSGFSAELSLDLQRALAGLDQPERAAILLCDAAGMSHAEAATALGAPLGSVKTYVTRARAKMRAALELDPSAARRATVSPANGT